MDDLFQSEGCHSGSDETTNAQPLAERLRPKSLSDIVGQEHLTGEQGLIGNMVKHDAVSSMIFWGPAGSGKTTVARILGALSNKFYLQVSAIFSGVTELKKIFAQAKAARAAGQGCLLFVDEIHRFNKAQLDSFLPVMEDGTITLIGSTTENPSFELNGALLSRSQVVQFKPLSEGALHTLLDRAVEVLGCGDLLSDEAKKAIIARADGDGRALISMVEQVSRLGGEAGQIGVDDLNALLSRKLSIYDKSDDGHYNLVSALHKAVRGSDPDAALYYLMRMFEGGEDRTYIARRLVRMASEDIGNADPQALGLCIAAQQAYHLLGSPEGELALAQACVYLATAPKSNATYVAAKAAHKDAKDHGSLVPPEIILNAPTSLMKAIGYGKDYRYDHDQPEGFSGQNYFPEKLGRRSYYQPVERGFEREISKRMRYWQKLRENKDN